MPKISAVFLQLDYSVMFLMFRYSNFVLPISRPVTIGDQIVWAFVKHYNFVITDKSKYTKTALPISAYHLRAGLRCA